MPRKIDLLGKRFGKLVVTKQVASRNERVMWKCACDCGGELVTRGESLRAGTSNSCGCSHITHGLGGTRIYDIWRLMMRRCHDPSNPAYPNYGGRGITVSPEWHDVTTFHKDLGDPPDGMSLERKDNNKGYSKDNCIWDTRKAQSRNTRRNVKVEHQGKIMTVAEWAECLGIDSKNVYRRIARGYTGAALFYAGRLPGKKRLKEKQDATDEKIK